MPLNKTRLILIYSVVSTLILIVIAWFVVLKPGGDKTVTPFNPVFTAAPCPASLPNPPAGTRCGLVTVPERHDKPEGKTIQLAVVVLKATGAKLQPDPIVFIDGGPGFSSLDSTLPLLAGPIGQPILDTGRDLVMVEQRGNYYSKPALTCPQVFDALKTSLTQDLRIDARTPLVAKAYAACRDQLKSQGIDLDAYNTVEVAADFPMVVQALGYHDYNIYGVSYGTEIAQHLMRDYPAGIRSAVLNAVLPLDLNVNAAIPTSADRAFKLLFSTCAGDGTCNGSYPNLETVFNRMVQRLNATPLRVQIKVAGSTAPVMHSVTGDDVVRLLSEAFDSDTIPSLPQIIYALDAGDPAWVTPRVGGATGTGTEALGMSYAAICAEGANFKPADMAQETVVEKAMAAGRPTEILSVCHEFDVARLPSVTQQPIHSAIPTLLMAGDFDIITPPPFLQRVASGLEHGYAFNYPGQGHGGIDICRLTMTLELYDSPNQAPDSSCIKSMKVTFAPAPAPGAPARTP